MIFVYLPKVAVPKMMKLPSHPVELPTLLKDDLLLSRPWLHTRNTPDTTNESREPIFGHSGAVICGSIFAAFVGLAILGCLLVQRRTLCYKRRGMLVRCWKKLRRTKDKDTAYPDPDPDSAPREEAALVQYQRGFFSICMGSQKQDQRISSSSTHPVRVIAVAAPPTTRSLPKPMPPSSSRFAASTQGGGGGTSKSARSTTSLPTTMTTSSRGLSRPLRPLIRPSALWPPPATGYSTYPSSKRRYNLSTPPTTRVVTRPRRPAPQAKLSTTAMVQSSSKCALSSECRWIGRLFRERRASADGTHISNYFNQLSPDSKCTFSESDKSILSVVTEKGVPVPWK
ncbi:unnamed protein product [Mortierella alpina]